jgi:transposase InsO family protein
MASKEEAMPWRETSTMEERIRLVKDCRSGLYEMTELCGRYSISRKTGYKWLRRFEAEGAGGLEDRSRAPWHCEHRMADSVRGALLEARRRHPTWGPRKLLAWLEARKPKVDWPAASSVGELLRREGLVAEGRRGRRREPHPGRPQLLASAPNDLWTADFKGQFRTRDWDWCYPLTVLDHVSRNCLGLQALDGTGGYGVRPVFERVFREAGLPLAILTDNGPPFVAPRGLHGLTELSVWWIRLGIRPLRTEPASPEQNGAHERFHRTLKAETGQPVAGNRIAQQRRFNRFRGIYNHERPHETLGQVPPATRWIPSPRAYPELLPAPDYPAHYLKRLVSSAGAFAFHHQLTHLSSALAGEWVGMEEVGDGIWSVYFCTEEVARYDERTQRLHR